MEVKLFLMDRDTGVKYHFFPALKVWLMAQWLRITDLCDAVSVYTVNNYKRVDRVCFDTFVNHSEKLRKRLMKD